MSRRRRRRLTSHGIARAYRVPAWLIDPTVTPPVRVRLRRYVERHLTPGVAPRLRDLPLPVVAAAAIAHPPAFVRYLRRAFALWTALPGDRFVWFVCDLTLEVVDVRRPGRPTLRVVGNAKGAPLAYGWHPEIYRCTPRPSATWGTVRPWDLWPEREFRRRA